MSNKNKKWSGVVYSTNPDFQYKREKEEDHQPSTSKGDQDIRIWLDRKGGGKVVSRVTGFTCKTSEIEELAKMLKQKCGVGGAVKEREILIQGDHRKKMMELLQKEGFRVKLAGG
ncbi:MAG: translation initiation factor [Bacteroidota bacterium]